MFKNKTILITGGTGSFGHAVLIKFLNTDIKEIRIFSRDEKKQEDMRIKYNNDKLKFYIGDVRDYNSVDFAMNGVDYVFHAAALKQVPSCEFYPMEAVKTNIIGTENVINSAVNHGVEKVIALSTDKAVYPINAMGLSKAIMEKIVIAKSRTIDNKKTILCITRYGNVMGSRGSVIPLFSKLIKENKPITVTDPQMTRYLMFLDEAVDLVIYAFQNAKQGDIFIRKSPASTIGDLAKAMLECYNANNEIKIIGTRHGEKLYETLITREEMVRIEDLKDYFRIPVDDRDLNYNLYFFEGKSITSSQKDYNSHNAERLNIKEIKKLLLKVDPIKNELKK